MSGRLPSSPPAEAAGAGSHLDTLIWHDVECGRYDADFELWRGLAGAAAGPLLEIGCGTGRVALELADAGLKVTGLDVDPAIVAELRARARRRGLRVRAAVADARSFELRSSFALIIAPMQVVQLLGGRQGREAMLSRARSHLRTGGLLAVAIADPLEGASAEDARPPLPDVLERDGWLYASTPVALRAETRQTVIVRARQAVSPAGELLESVAEVRLDELRPDELEESARGHGFAVRSRSLVPPTPDYVGSSVVTLEAV